MRSRDVAGAATGVVLGLALLSQPAEATPGILNQGMNLRAGPGVDYPWIASLPPGTQAEIFGCLPEWSWCDVATQGLRGWVAGVGLQVLYEDQPEPLTAYGAEIGLPFIGFDFGNYWGRYYRGRPWYSQTDRWHDHGGPREGWNDGQGQPDGYGRREQGGPGGIAARDRGNGAPESVEPRDRPGSAGPGPFQGPQPGIDHGNPYRGPQPRTGAGAGGVPRGGLEGRGAGGPSGGPQAARPGGQGHPGNPQGAARGGPEQHDPH